jgi:hypothetical protein
MPEAERQGAGRHTEQTEMMVARLLSGQAGASFPTSRHTLAEEYAAMVAEDPLLLHSPGKKYSTQTPIIDARSLPA